MEKANNLKVSILGKPYQIVTDEAQENILEASLLVDGMMKEKTKGLPVTNESKIAVVTALELATDLGKCRKSLKAFENKVIELDGLLEIALQ